MSEMSTLPSLIITGLLGIVVGGVILITWQGNKRLTVQGFFLTLAQVILWVLFYLAAHQHLP